MIASVFLPFRRLLVLLIVALSAATIVGCGDDGDGGDAAGNASVDELLEKTFSKSTADRGRMNLSMNLDVKGAEGVSGPIAIRMSGPFQSQGEDKLPNFDFSLSLALGGPQRIAAGALVTGNKGFLKLQGQAFEVDKALFDQFSEVSDSAGKDSKDRTTFSRIGVDPRRWLVNARKVGDAKVAGADTVHVTGTVAVGPLIDDMNTILGKAPQLGVAQADDIQKITADQKRQIARAVKSSRVDIYTGKDDTILRKLNVTADLDVPADLRKEAGLDSGKLVLTLEFSEVGEDQEIEAPKNARPFSELISAFGGDAGALGLGGGSGSSPTPSPPAAPAPAPNAGLERYTQCLQKAGDDIRKAQECAGLLGR